MSEIEKKKNWKILVPYGTNEMADVALQQAIDLCRVFNASLILFRCVNKAEDVDKEKQHLAKILAHMRMAHGIEADAFVPVGSLRQLLFAVAQKTESILIVIGHNGKNTSLDLSLGACLRFMRKSRTPFIMTPLRCAGYSYKNIAISVSYHRQEKEKILWASYFSRIYKSHIHIMLPQAKDGFFASGIRGNMMVLNRLYKNLEIDYKIYAQPANVNRIHEAAMNWSSENRVGVYVMLTTSRHDIFDLISGSVEKNACIHPSGIPVLCINPRDDLYVLCN